LCNIMKYFNIFIISILMLILDFRLLSQPSPEMTSFSPPLDFNLSVSGNFGEIRTDHFHSGIDIRTQGVSGKKVYAAASGYVSRIKIESGGYGKTLYLTHPGGLMTVYAHLDHFNPEIEKYVKDKQYEEKTHAINIFPLKSEFPVIAGQHIAYSGNTGYSFGPHLHFEIRNSANQNIRNVLLYDLGIRDLAPPKIFSVCLYPEGKNSYVNNSPEKQIMQVINDNGRYKMKNDQSVFVTGNIGFGIEAYDYLDGSASRCGIYIIELYADSTMVFSWRMDEFSFGESRYINSFIDYEEKQKTSRNIQKAYIEPNNRLSVYGQSVNRGIVGFHDEKPHQISFVLKDVYQNTTRLDFTVKGQAVSNLINSDTKNDFIQYMPCAALNTFERYDVRLIIPEGAIYTDLEFEYSKIPDSDSLFSPVHIIHNIYTPLQLACELFIRPENLPVSLQDKAVLVRINKNGEWECAGGEWTDGFVKGSITGFGNYAVSADTTPPVIKPLNFSGIPDMSDKNSILFRVKDDLSGIMSYEGYIDGDWALFEYDAKNDLVFYKFDPERITRQSNHDLELYIVDNKQNINFYYTEFYW
jgi:hypothetical protein